MVFEEVKRRNRIAAHYVPAIADVAAQVLPLLRQNDLVLVIGAGSISALGPQLVELLSNSSPLPHAGAPAAETDRERGNMIVLKTRKSTLTMFRSIEGLECHFDEPLDRHTSMKMKSRAALFAIAHSARSLRDAMRP